MLKQGKDCAVGDYVEVKKVQRTGLVVDDIWIKARCCWIDEKQVGVIYDDGNREMFERGVGLVRLATD